MWEPGCLHSFSALGRERHLVRQVLHSSPGGGRVQGHFPHTEGSPALGMHGMLSAVPQSTSCRGCWEYPGPFPTAPGTAPVKWAGLEPAALVRGSVQAGFAVIFIVNRMPLCLVDFRCSRQTGCDGGPQRQLPGWLPVTCFVSRGDCLSLCRILNGCAESAGGRAWKRTGEALGAPGRDGAVVHAYVHICV